ncbi:class II aldolase/adducin N-terminal [Aspergillus cavernicola]|uniref:Class II aldolase/adducin N-terminal n=1 Tax=Aspergillus cavernicola TaxID=176166 RepID=A0ABR4HR45_9EURO
MTPAAITESAHADGSSTVPKDTHVSSNVTPLEAMGHKNVALPKIPVFESFAAQRQWQLEHMVRAFHVFAREGYAEGISGHISVRDPEFEDRFWINPLAVHFGMMQVSDLICIDMEGNVVDGNTSVPANAAGVSIHTACHLARPDVHAICHTHSLYGRAWSVFARRLEMLSQDACYLYNAHSVYESFGGIALSADEGKQIAAALGSQNKACILQNHGLLTVGGTVDEAAYLFLCMERSCKGQLLIEAAAANGIPKRLISHEEAEYTFRMASDPQTLYWEFQPHLRYEEYCDGHRQR